MGEHGSDEFGKSVPTVFGSGLNDPDLTAYSAPAMIRLAGVDEQATASKRLVAPTPRPGAARVPLWVWAALLAALFVIGVIGLLVGMRSGFFRQPEERRAFSAVQQRHQPDGQTVD